MGSGARGNSTIVDINGYRLLFDAGFSYKELKKRLIAVGQDIDTIQSIFISHHHSDHTQALTQFQKKQQVKIYSSLPETVKINDFMITPFVLSHDEPCTGFRLQNKDFSFVYASDTGCIPEVALKYFFDATVVALEFNYDLEMLTENPKYPTKLIERIVSNKGHMDNIESSRILSEVNHKWLKLVIPIHISEKNNNKALVQYEAQKNVSCRVVCADQHTPTEMFYFM